MLVYSPRSTSKIPPLSSICIWIQYFTLLPNLLGDRTKSQSQPFLVRRWVLFLTRRSLFFWYIRITVLFPVRWGTVTAWMAQPYMASVTYRWLQITAFYTERPLVRLLVSRFGEVPWLTRGNVVLNKHYNAQKVNWIETKMETPGKKRNCFCSRKAPLHSILFYSTLNQPSRCRGHFVFLSGKNLKLK